MENYSGISRADRGGGHAFNCNLDAVVTKRMYIAYTYTKIEVNHYQVVINSVIKM